MVVKVKVLQAFRVRGGAQYHPGDVTDLSEDVVAWAQAGGLVEEVHKPVTSAEHRALEQAPVDRMLRKPGKAK